jgi:hypothetical protein
MDSSERNVVQRLVDEMMPSASLGTPTSQEWALAVTEFEQDVNDIFSLVCPDLFRDGMKSIEKIQKEHPNHGGVQAWSSVFNGIGVIANRITIPHRDPAGRSEWYDLLLAAGTYDDAYLDVHDLGAQFTYKPGTVIAICGRLLRHGIDRWNGGERICYAHYMRNNVLHRQGIQSSSWVYEHIYFPYMSRKFVDRRGV